MEHVVVAQVFNWPDRLVMCLASETEQHLDLHLAREAHNLAKSNPEKSKWFRVFSGRSPLINSRVMQNVLCHLRWSHAERALPSGQA